MRIEDNNMGNMSEAEAYQFFKECNNALGSDCKLKIGKCGGSFYDDIGGICMDERDLDNVRWRVKEIILHELAHHFIKDNATSCRHGTEFYRIYAELLNKFMVGD